MRQCAQQGFGAPIRHQQTQGAASRGEHCSFHQQLPHQVPASGADGEADTHLAPPRRGARHGETGHVGAGDQQRQAGHGHQRQQRRLLVLAKLVDALRRRTKFQAILRGVRIGSSSMLLGQLELHADAMRGIRGSLGARDTCAGRQAGHDVQPANLRIVEGRFPRELKDALHRDGKVDLRLVAGEYAVKRRRRDADHGRRVTVHLNRLADRGGVAGEALQPIAVAQDRHRLSVGAGVVLGTLPNAAPTPSTRKKLPETTSVFADSALPR